MCHSGLRRDSGKKITAKGNRRPRVGSREAPAQRAVGAFVQLRRDSGCCNFNRPRGKLPSKGVQMVHASPRDLVGYAGSPPDPKWPGEARLALNIVMNYEEGSEYQFLVDGESEKVLSEVPGGYTGLKRRDLAIESIYEYGSRVGFWRLMRLFSKYGVPITVTGCAQ